MKLTPDCGTTPADRDTLCSWEASGLVLNKCKYMDSKKVLTHVVAYHAVTKTMTSPVHAGPGHVTALQLPLWLVFKNSDPTGKPIYVMLKSGDDLRQDMLTLQLITIMDKARHHEVARKNLAIGLHAVSLRAWGL